MPEEMKTWEAVQVPSTSIKPRTDVGLEILISQVQLDQWNGTTEFDRATRDRAELFSRLRFPRSSIGSSVKKPA